MVAVRYSETLVSTYKSTRPTPHENLKFQISQEEHIFYLPVAIWKNLVVVVRLFGPPVTNFQIKNR
jgi:hypothetical protein